VHKHGTQGARQKGWSDLGETGLVRRRPHRCARRQGTSCAALLRLRNNADLCALQVYFWTTIRKNRGGRYSASRGLNEEDIAGILRQHVIVNRDVNEAMQNLAQVPGLKKFMATLKDNEREQFKRHLRRYVSIYMPDCPIEVTTTNRYTITDHEASITARRDIQAREEIKYLTGVQVAMTEEQETALELARKDFSLVVSSRKKTRSLFLGPARFANHDCDPNARLSTKGYDGMQIVAAKAIKQGEEITVSYGQDYFGRQNVECLCQTCEKNQANGWASYKLIEESDDDENDEKEGDEDQQTVNQKAAPASQRGAGVSHRKRKSDSLDNDPGHDTEHSSKRTKIDALAESIRLKPVITRKKSLKRMKPSKLSDSRQQSPISSIEDSTADSAPSPREIRTQQRDSQLYIVLDEDVSSRGSTPRSSVTAASPKSSMSTDATMTDEDHPTVDAGSQDMKVDPNTVVAKPTLGVATIKDETTTVTTPWPPLFDDGSSSELSELSESLDFDDVLQRVIKRKRSKTPPVPRNTRSLSRTMSQNRIGTPIPDFEEGWVENDRKPGDYMTSRSRLSGKDSKWVQCQTCDNQFVQMDGHRGTRKECPRCERHSKLYGYAWPKTDKEGKHDKEKRILDHRSIHRFVDPEEEKVLKKDKPKRKFKEEILERFSTPRSGRDSSMSMEVEGGRYRKRARKTM